MRLIDFLAQACHFAQEHIDDEDTWTTDADWRTRHLMCVSFQVACFLSQHTVEGRGGVPYDVVLDELVQHPMKTEQQWRTIIRQRVADLGGFIDTTIQQSDEDVAPLVRDLLEMIQPCNPQAPELLDHPECPEGHPLACGRCAVAHRARAWLHKNA